MYTSTLGTQRLREEGGELEASLGYGECLSKNRGDVQLGHVPFEDFRTDKSSHEVLHK